MAWQTAGNIRGPQGTTGATGPQGVQGPQGPAGPVGPAGLNWRGNWTSNTAYAEDDAVAYSGSSYFASTAIAASTTPPTNDDGITTNPGWAKLASEGAVGPQGPQGPQGEQGPQGSTGSIGPTGPTGATGAKGDTGIRGSQWYVGTGAPTTGNTPGALVGDKYLDRNTGDVYTLA